MSHQNNRYSLHSILTLDLHIFIFIFILFREQVVRRITIYFGMTVTFLQMSFNYSPFSYVTPMCVAQDQYRFLLLLTMLT